MNIFQTIADKIGSFFKKEAPIVENAFTNTNGIVNIIKTFLGSVTGQTVEAIIEAFFPGVSAVIISALNTFFTDYGLVQSEVGKTPTQLAADGLNAISKLTGNSKVLALANVAAIIGHSASSANGGDSTLQQSLVAQQVIYNPNVLGSAPTTEAAPVTA